MARASSDRTADRAVLRFVQRHERALIVAWLVGCAALLAFLGVWGIALNGAERAVERWDSRWIAELDELEPLVRAGQCEQAAARLERLDRDCPAVFVKHRFDRERERLLGMLGECYVRLDKRKKAIATLERLAAFDPRNFDNHFRLAEAQRAFGDLGRAREAYEQVLAIHPTHLPSVAAVIDMAFDAGRYEPIVEAYQRYLDAWLLRRVRLSVGGATVAFELPADGEQHLIDVPAEVARDSLGEIALETFGYSARIESIEVVPPLRVGVAEEPAPLHLRPGDGWRAEGGTSPASGELIAGERSSRLVGPGVSLPQGAARIRVRLALFKHLTEETWAQVRTSCRNRLELERLRDAERRSRVGGCLGGDPQDVD